MAAPQKPGREMVSPMGSSGMGFKKGGLAKKKK